MPTEPTLTHSIEDLVVVMHLRGGQERLVHLHIKPKDAISWAVSTLPRKEQDEFSFADVYQNCGAFEERLEALQLDLEHKDTLLSASQARVKELEQQLSDLQVEHVGTLFNLEKVIEECSTRDSLLASLYADSIEAKRKNIADAYSYGRQLLLGIATKVREAIESKGKPFAPTKEKD